MLDTLVNTNESQKNEHDFLFQARQRAIEAYDYHKENMDNANQDINFLYGNQYDPDELAELLENNRIAMTFNKLPQFVNNVIGSQRSNTQTIKVTPTGASIGKEEPKITTQKGKEYKLSDIYTDLIRDIEYTSNAKQWYQTSFKHAVEGGFGWLRVITKYQEDGFDQEILIKGIRDRFSVLIDPRAKEPDRSDANYAFIFGEMSRKEFNKRYPNKSSDTLAGANEDTTLWYNEDNVIVAEYFRRVPKKKKLLLLSDGSTHYEDDIKDVLDELASNGITITNERMVTKTEVIWCKISAGSILEDDQVFPTSTIPIVPIFGREVDMKDKIRLKGLISDAKDAQKALNRLESSALEKADTAPLAPWIASDKAIEGHEIEWAEANTTNLSVLTYKAGQQPPQKTPPTPMPVAELQMSNTMDNHIKDSVGMQNASVGKQSNEISGKAIRARQAEADTANFEILDNYTRAIRRVGILVTELIPIIYDGERAIRIRSVDGKTDTVEINKTIVDEQTGKAFVINDLGLNKHTAVVTTGANYETAREENAEKILELMKVSPKVADIATDLLVNNIDFGDNDKLAERLLKTVPLNLLDEDEKEEVQKNQPKPEPSPEQLAQQAEMQGKQIEQQIKQEDNATKLELEKIKLETAKINLEIKRLEAVGKARDSGV